MILDCIFDNSVNSSFDNSCNAIACLFRTITSHPFTFIGYACSTSQYLPSNMVGPGDIRFSPELDKQVQHSICLAFFVLQPNGSRLSRLAGCAILGSVYNKRHRRLLCALIPGRRPGRFQPRVGRFFIRY